MKIEEESKVERGHAHPAERGPSWASASQDRLISWGHAFHNGRLSNHTARSARKKHCQPSIDRQARSLGPPSNHNPCPRRALRVLAGGDMTTTISQLCTTAGERGEDSNRPAYMHCDHLGTSNGTCSLTHCSKSSC